ncbi:hypothetical protein ACIQ9J_25850 [Streptomyces sp. NPDC094153]|uniref:hypothetical protein n=1 Tax=Streptomyces sp. NPDC094153 TaxID=3366058 RepID=UPI00382D9F61
MVAIHAPSLPADALARCGKVAFAAAPHDRADHTEPGREHGSETTRLATGQASRSCTVYDWCEETGDHIDHIGATRTVLDTRGDELVRCNLIHLSDGQPVVTIRDSDFAPVQARMKARELRELADAMDVMAAKVETARARG